MRVTLINLFKKTVPGHIFRGKRRLVKPVSSKSMNTLINEYEQQESNMFLLRHPYLTIEESSGHTKELGKHDALIKKWNDSKQVMRPNITIADRLSHLKVRDTWD